MAKPRGRLIILESANPIDVLQDRSEAQTLAAACKLIGYEATSYPIRSLQEFKDTLDYIATIHDKRTEVPLFVHVSCHGDEDGLQFGAKEAKWKDLIKLIEPLCELTAYKGPCILSISACGAGEHTLWDGLSKVFKKNPKSKPPPYLFVTNAEEVHWDDAIVAWVILYHWLANHGLDDRKQIRETLKSICSITGLSLKYSRWDQDDKEYKQFTGK